MKRKIFTALFIIGTMILMSCSGSKSLTKETNEPNYETNQKSAMAHFIAASTAETAGNFSNAISEYKAALKYDSSSGINYSLAKTYFKINKLKDALFFAKKAVNLDGENIDYLKLNADIYLSADNRDSAEVYYNKIISLDSTFTEAYFQLGLIYEIDRPLQALEVYKNLLQKVGPAWEILVKIVDLNERLGNSNEMISTIEKLQNINPAEIKIQKILIESYLKNGDYEKALKFIDKAQRTFPEDTQLQEYRASIFLHQLKYEKSAQEYKKLFKYDNVPFDSKVKIASMFIPANGSDSTLIPLAKMLFEDIEKDSSNWQVNVYLGEIAVLEQDDSSAINYFIEASGQAKWNSRVWQRLGELLFRNAKYEKAIEMLSTIEENFPDDFFINLILGLSYSQTENYEKGSEILLKAVELNPNDINALSALGFSLNQLKREDEALVYLQRALRIDSDNLQVLGILGMIYDGKKDYAKTDDYYGRALTVDSTDIVILNNWAYSLSERNLELEKCLEMSQKTIEAEPENPSYLDTYGWIQFKLGNNDLALKYILKALEFDKKNSTILEHLGDVYFNLNNKLLAKEYWEKALDRNRDNTEIIKKIRELNN